MVGRSRETRPRAWRDRHIRVLEVVLALSLLAGGSALSDTAGQEVTPDAAAHPEATELRRGAFYDRHGIPLAADAEVITRHAGALRQLGFDPYQACPEMDKRCYPFSVLTYHLLGDIRAPRVWDAPWTDYLEATYERRRQALTTLVLPSSLPTGPFTASDEAIRDALDGDVTLTLDARLQVRVARLLEGAVQRRKLEGGAVVVLDAATGEVLASVSYPWPEAIGPALNRVGRRSPELRDRARFGLYPPGSTFKLVTAMAALRKDPALEHVTHRCRKLEGRRVGAILPGWRTVRDDEKDRYPHGDVDLQKGLWVSCNAYFAQLGVYSVGPEALIETAGLFGIDMAWPNEVAELEKTLEQSAFGQGEVVASPLQMAVVAASVANDGRMVPPRVVLRGWLEPDPGPSIQVVTLEQARMLAGSMRRVVTHGTARAKLGKHVLPIAGKTGTAEVDDEPSHAWFVGFAPYLEPAPPAGESEYAAPAASSDGAEGAESATPAPPARTEPEAEGTTGEGTAGEGKAGEGTTGEGTAGDGAGDGEARRERRIVVSVVLEHAGYCGDYAAPLAGEIFQAARELDLVR